MDAATDSYKTLSKPSKEILFKEKKSKFYGYAFPIKKESEVKPIIEKLKRQHSSANHVCFAWQLGVENPIYRANDDGEPNNSAGMPIYGQIQSLGVTDVLVAVVRIFGGTKLGVGGLITAYRTSAKMALKASKIIEKTLQQRFELSFSYPEMDIVMRTIKQRQLDITSQKLEFACKLIISVRQRDANEIKKVFGRIYGVEINSMS